MTAAFSQEVVSSGGYQQSLSVSTFIHDTPVGGSAVVVSHYSLAPGFQLNSSLLLHIQQEALSAASPNLRTAFFLSLPLSPTAVSSF